MRHVESGCRVLGGVQRILTDQDKAYDTILGVNESYGFSARK